MKRFSLGMTGGVRCALALLWAVGGLAALAPGASAQPVPGPPSVLDGPSAAIDALNGLSVARDGTGGLVYLKRDDSGIEHVFVSRLLGGSFQPPEEVDATLGTASSQPVIAAGNGGVLLVAFVNGGQLDVTDRTSTSSPWSAPAVVSGAASDPSLSMSNFGKGYLAFTAAGAGGGHDVRAAYYYNGRWAAEGSALNAVPDDDAGTGTGRPVAGAAGDGVAVIVWGEGGHIYSRRVWGTSPSVVYEQADASSVSSCTELVADSPQLGTEGDSSFAPVVFHEQLQCGAHSQQSRVLMNRLHGSAYDGVTQPDGLASPGTEGAGQQQVAIGEYGSGWATSARTSSHQLFGAILGTDAAFHGVLRLDSLSNVSNPYAVPAMAGVYSDLIAWQQSPGTSGIPEIRVRYAPDGASLGPEQVLSSPDQGPTAAASGLLAAGDGGGDAAVAWVQGAPGSAQIVTAQLYQPPGPPAPLRAFAYAHSSHPRLAWSPAGRWGPMQYTVSIDGAQVAQTGATSVAVPATVADGRHRWRVSAINRSGHQSISRFATVFVDTIPPQVKLTLRGARRVSAALQLNVTYRDLPPRGKPRRVASGVAKVTINWGDRSITKLRLGSHRRAHAYRRAGRYKLTVTVIDHAGNVTRSIIIVRIPGSEPSKPSSRGRP